ncbi:MAG: Ig-like domain-containing protein, partial [Acidobacteriota bacterium]|nr:Ig-like domain-containing protein [Acidobacteriota bacterium]
VLWGTGYRNFFNGAIDDVALYKRVLTATEIANAAAGARLAECGAVPVILESPGDQSGEEGDAVSLVLNAAVGEGRVAQFEAVGLPPGLSIGMHDGVIAGTIAEGVAGTYPVTVRLSDSLTEATVSFLWTVTVPPVPVLTLRAGAGAILTVLETGAQCLGGDANGMFDRTCAIEVPAGTYTVQGTTSLSMSRLRWHWTFAVPHEVPAEADRVTVQVVDAADVGGALLGTFVVDRVWEAGGGPGTVTSSLPPYLDGEPGFGCGAGAKCVGQALLGTTVTLTAGRAGDHIFESWGGGCEGTDPVCQLYIDPLIYVRELSTPLAHAHFTVYQPPHLANPGGQQSYEGETISLPLTWSAGDARNVAFMATGLPPGLVIGQSTGVISGTLTMESSGTFQVTVTISDGERDWPSTFWWVVDDMNQDPVAVDDALEIDRNTPTFTIPAAQLLANDSDPDGDDLFIIAVGGSTNGLAVLRQDGNVDFTVNPVFHGTASFVYDVSDGRGGSAPANVVITVVLVNDDPIAVDDTAVTLGGAVTIEVLANDSDPDGDPVTITGIAVAPAKGSATIDGSSIIYTPTSMVYDGADTFTYAIEDGQGGTASATVTIATPPGELVDVSVAIVGVERDPDTGIPYVRMRVRNDGPATEPMVRFTAFSEVWLGMMQAVRLLEPAPGAACDPAPEVPLSHGIGAGACTIADMAPGAEVSIAVFVHPWTTSSPRTLPVSGRVRLDRIDADYSNNLVHEAVTIPLSVSDMSVSLSALPTSYRIGEPVTFTVEVRNAGPDVSVSRPLTLTLDGTGTSPFGCPAGAVTEGRSAWHCRVPSLEVGAVWTTSFEHVSSVAGTRASTARLFVTASEVYYTTDPDVANNEVSIDTIASENRTPVAVDDNRETDEDTPLEIAPATLLANDTDADGDTLTLVAVSDTAVNGTVTFEAGVIVFTPAPDFHGAASFQYQVSDGYDATAWGTVHITVHSVNDDPVVPDQLVDAVSGVPITIPIGATDVDGDKLAYAIEERPAHGSAELVDDAVVYTANAGFNGTDAIVVKADDGAGGTETGRIRIQVTRSNEPPAFDGVTVEVPANGTATVTLAAVDPDDDTVTYRITAGPEFGTATLAGDQLTYTPAADFEGSEKVVLEADDGRGGTTEAQVTFVVTPVNQPPFVGVPLPDLTLLEDALPFVVDLDGAFKDAEDVDGLTYTASSDNPGVVTVSVNGVAGTVTLALVPDAFGVATVTVVASDGEFEVADAFVVTVREVNDPPRLDQPANVRVVGGTEVVVPLTGLAAGPASEEGQIVSVTAVSSSASVTGAVTATLGELRFTPPVRTNVGVATVTVEVADNGGTENGGLDRTTRTFTVTILPPPPT